MDDIPVIIKEWNCKEYGQSQRLVRVESHTPVPQKHDYIVERAIGYDAMGTKQWKEVPFWGDSMSPNSLKALCEDLTNELGKEIDKDGQ